MRPPKRGRPRGSTQERTLNEMLRVRMSSSEFLANQRAAREKRMSLSRWVRAVLTEARKAS